MEKIFNCREKESMLLGNVEVDEEEEDEATGRCIDSRKLGLERTFDLFEKRRRRERM